jgi:hypothetical protein
MHQFVITRAAVIQGWAVRCNGQTLSTHFTEGLAVADALRRAQQHADDGFESQVYRHEDDGRFTELAMVKAPPPREHAFKPTMGTELGGRIARIPMSARLPRAINDTGT